MRNAVKRLSVAGLRGLIKEEAARARGRGRRLQEASDPQITPGVEDAIDALTDAIIESADVDLTATDDMRPEVHNDILACVEKIFETYDFQGSGDDYETSDDDAFSRGVMPRGT